MHRWSFAFLVFAVVSGFLGFGPLTGDPAGIAKILFFVFVVAMALTYSLDRRAV
jgi:uncharacterized membrane protein YtjA (UPF0391 family)